MIENETFREDLYYRINVIPIHLPVLTDRINDIELLSYHFISKYNEILNKNITKISEETLDVLKSYNWPGNVRELENAIEYAINMEDTSTIQVSNIPNRIRKFVDSNISIKEVITEKENSVIVNLLDKNGWDLAGKEKVAEELGISLRTLYRRLNNISL